MSSPICLEAAKKTQEKLSAIGLPSTLKEIPNNEYLAKLETEFGNVCIYVNAKAKVTIQTHEIKNLHQRAIVEEAINKSTELDTILPTGKWTIYTDGSAKGGQCGWSAVTFKPDGTKDREKSGNLGPQANGQIAGEVEGAISAIRRAVNTGTKELLIRHDYEGVGNWGRGEWKDRDPDATRLKRWANHAKKAGVSITFEWFKGHNGDPGNERADKLAGEATILQPSPRIPDPVEKTGPDMTL